jgi:hypothetical protein
MPTESIVCRSTEITPVQSSAASAGPPQMSVTAPTGSVSVASTVWVAPRSEASRSRAGCRSTAMIVVAGEHRAAITAASPTVPAP